MRIQSIPAAPVSTDLGLPRALSPLLICRRKREFLTAGPFSTSRPQKLCIQCAVIFRPCIDIHKGKVKQIVGSTLQDSKEGNSTLITNFESAKSAAEYAKIYKVDGLTGGHAIMLGADLLSQLAAIEALRAYPDFPLSTSCEDDKI